MERATINGVTLEYQVVGVGEPVLFIHGALVADAFQPLLAEPSLAPSHQLIIYHRRGYLGSDRLTRPLSIAEHANDGRALLGHLGLERAHVVGHSTGGTIAIQLTLDHGSVVHSLALLEPALVVGSGLESYRESLRQAAETFDPAHAAEAVDRFLVPRFGEGYRPELERLLPGAFEQAVAQAETSIRFEPLPLLESNLGEVEIRGITRPTLVVIGERSASLMPRIGATDSLLRAWLPDAEHATIPGSAHGLPMQNPSGLAETLAGFFARHPMPA